MNIIKAINLAFGYSQEPILKDLSLDIAEGSFLAIAGPNGAGKTTLLKILYGLLKPSVGKVMIQNAKLSSYTSKTLARKIAVVPQEFVPAFSFSVIETVMMARTTYFGRMGFETKKKILISSTIHLKQRILMTWPPGSLVR